MANIVLCNIADRVKTVNEMKFLWINEVLEALGVPEEVINFKDIREFRHFLAGLGIEVVTSTDGGVIIYKQRWFEHQGISGWLPEQEDDIVAHWKEPNYVKRIEGKDAYYEIHLNEWSIKNMRARK